MQELVVCLQVVIAASIFFVWVVRYDNIVEEFKGYPYPAWLRDLVGIFKLSFAVLLLLGIERGVYAVIAGLGIAVLMAGAIVTHIRVKNGFSDMLPSLSLLILALLVAWSQSAATG